MKESHNLTDTDLPCPFDEVLGGQMEIILLICLFVFAWIMHEFAYKSPKQRPEYYVKEPTVKKECPTNLIAADSSVSGEKLTTITQPTKLVIQAEDDAFRK